MALASMCGVTNHGVKFRHSYAVYLTCQVSSSLISGHLCATLGIQEILQVEHTRTCRSSQVRGADHYLPGAAILLASGGVRPLKDGR